MARLALTADERWAILSDDKKNGFNAISRASIFAGLRRWFPELIPCARLFYSRAARLYTSGKLGRTPARDEDGIEFFSMEGLVEGCTQARMARKAIRLTRSSSLLATTGLFWRRRRLTPMWSSGHILTTPTTSSCRSWP